MQPCARPLRGSITSSTSMLLGIVATLGITACSAGEGPVRDDPRAVGTAASAIIHGTASPASQDAVVMITMVGGGFCSGTLIAPNVVLTARHCVTNTDENTECGTFKSDIDPATLGIVTGANGSETSPAVAHAQKAFYVDGVKDLCGGVDIALLLLDRAVSGVPIAKVRTTPAKPGETVFAVGYGEDENKEVSTRRQRTGVRVLAVGPSNQTFTPTNAAAFTYELSVGELSVSEAACHGDSGGPVFDASGLILGVTSRGADPADVCVARPDIYTGVVTHLAVIDRALVAAGHPRSASTTTSPSSEDDPTGEEPSADDATTKAPSKRTTTGTLAMPSSGCSASARPPRGDVGSWLLGLALATIGRARRRARGSRPLR